MSTHNICFHGEIRKIVSGYPVLSVAIFMVKISIIDNGYSLFVGMV